MRERTHGAPQNGWRRAVNCRPLFRRLHVGPPAELNLPARVVAAQGDGTTTDPHEVAKVDAPRRRIETGDFLRCGFRYDHIGGRAAGVGNASHSVSRGRLAVGRAPEQDAARGPGVPEAE